MFALRRSFCFAGLRSALSSLKYCSNDPFSIDYKKDLVPVMDSQDNSLNYSEWETKSKVATFTDLFISSDYRRLMKREGIVTPTPIQIQALPLTTKYTSPHIVIESMTGSGKTLAYLLPAIIDTRQGLHTVIMVPSRELAIQVYHQALQLIPANPHDKKVSVLYKGENEEQRLKEFAQTLPNILVATPNSILGLIRGEHSKRLSTVFRLVLDEADKMLIKDVPASEAHRRKEKKHVYEHVRPAREVTKWMLQSTKFHSTRLQVVCTSATVSDSLKKELEDVGLSKDRTEMLVSHAYRVLPPEIQHHYIRCGNESVQLDKMAQHFINSNTTAALVFVHRDDSVMQAADYIKNKYDINAVPLYKQVVDYETYTAFLKDFRKGVVQMAVASEESMRGLDFKFLTTMYMLVVPKNANEYLHLAGRVGRVGKRGAAIVMVGDDDYRNINRIQRIYKTLKLTGSEIEPLVDIAELVRNKNVQEEQTNK